MAPEIPAHKQYDKSVDIWALGVLSYLMLFSSLPFKNLNMNLEIKTKCEKGFDLYAHKVRYLESFSN